MNFAVHCNDDILDPTWERSLVGSINYLVCMTIGNTLLMGIVDFKRSGGDPMKRTVLNQLTSLVFESLLVHGTLTGSGYLWIVFFGPSGPNLAALIIIARYTLITFAFLAFCQYIWIQCLVTYRWQSVVLHYDFWPRYLTRINLIMSLLLGGTYYVFDFYQNENYANLSCQESG